MLDLDEAMNILDMTLNDPCHFDCTLFEGTGVDGVMVDSPPLSIVENKPYTVDEGYLSACCRFVTLLMSMPPMSGGVPELDVGF